MDTTSLGDNLKLAKSSLIAGSLVAIPTETVYGLAANAFDDLAVRRIYEAKNRPLYNPLIVHVASLEQVETLVRDIPKIFYDLASTFWPGPLTMLLTKRSIISDLVTAHSPKVAIRIPNHPLTLELLRSIDFPLAAPSANPFGYVSPTTAEHVSDCLGDRVSYILDGGPCKVGIESTIISISSRDEIFLHRLGAISVEDLEKKFGKKVQMIDSKTSIQTPGSSKSHYAPNKKLIIGDIKFLMRSIKEKKFGILAFDRAHDELDEKLQYVLSKRGCLHEAAQNLFTGLRYLDGLDIELILANYVPPAGIGLSINDKLERASYKSDIAGYDSHSRRQETTKCKFV